MNKNINGEEGVTVIVVSLMQEHGWHFPEIAGCQLWLEQVAKENKVKGDCGSRREAAERLVGQT